MLERWCTGAPHAGVETGVPSRLWTGVTNHREVVLLSTKTEGEKKREKLIRKVGGGVHKCTHAVDLEIFVLRNFCVINFCVEKIFVRTTPYHINVNSAH